MWHYDLSNPYKQQVLKYANDLLKDRYPKYHLLLQRVTAGLVVQQDAESFAKMLVDVFEVGYLRAVEDYRKAVEPYGLKIQIRPSTSPEQPASPK